MPCEGRSPSKPPRHWGSCGGDQPLLAIQESPPLRPGSPQGTKLSGAARLIHPAAPRGMSALALPFSWPGTSQVGDIRPSPTAAQRMPAGLRDGPFRGGAVITPWWHCQNPGLCFWCPWVASPCAQRPGTAAPRRSG